MSSAETSTHRVLMALLFFPRGGSAQVMRYLARFLPRAGSLLSVFWAAGL